MIKRAFKKSHFTLVELLVAMAIFTILLMVSMQIFGSSQKLWVNSEQKNNAFASARSAMEFIAARIQSNAYSEDMPFFIDSSGDANSSMYFPTTMPMNRKDDSGKERDRFNLRFIGFAVTDSEPLGTFHNPGDGILRMIIYSDEGKISFLRNTPPYRRTTYESARANVKGNTLDRVNDNTAGNEHNIVDIAENVTAFRLKGYTLGHGTGNSLQSVSGELNHPPYLLVIQLSVMDSKTNFEKWQNAANDTERNEIFQENGYTFQRAVLLRQRRAK